MNLSVVVLCSILFIACNQVDNSAKLEKQKLDSLQTELESLKLRVQSIEEKNETDDLIQTMSEVAYLTPGDQGYAVVQSDISKLTVSLDNIESYANGSKVTLRFGNPTSAKINGLNARIEWGKADKVKGADNLNAKYRDVTFIEVLKPASWTKVKMVLEDVPPSELGFVRIKRLRHTGIGLAFANGNNYE